MSVNPRNKIEVNNTIGHFINGEERIDNNRPTPITDPATGKVT
ncbi:MAG: hypothetical protein ACI9LY_003769, partial [Arenicella sp.]